MASGATRRRASSTACAARRWPAPTEAESTRMRGGMKLFPLCGPPFPVPQARLDPLLDQSQWTDSPLVRFAAKLLVNLLAQRQGKQVLPNANCQRFLHLFDFDAVSSDVFNIILIPVEVPEVHRTLTSAPTSCPPLPACKSPPCGRTPCPWR